MRKMASRFRIQAGVLFALLALVSILAGCGSSSSSSSSAESTSGSAEGSSASAEESTPASSEGGGESVAGVPTLEELTSKGTETQPPPSGPLPKKGGNVWWVSCGLSNPSCAIPAKAAEEAAGIMGIEFHIADGKQNVGGGDAAAFRTALAAKPEAIIVHGISCSAIEGPLREAKEDDIPVMGVESLDCSEPSGDGPALFTAAMKYAPGSESNAEYFNEWGKLTADYMIAASEGRAAYILNAGTEPEFEDLNDGFVNEVKKCPECEMLEEVPFVVSDLLPDGPWVQRLRASVVKNPTAEWVMMPFSPNLELGAPTVTSALPNAKMFGGSGEAPVIELVRQGKIAAVTAAHDAKWMGWAAMDNINRVLNGQPTVVEGVGFRVVDKEHNLPKDTGSGYESPIDFAAGYEKLWSTGK